MKALGEENEVHLLKHEELVNIREIDLVKHLPWCILEDLGSSN